MNKTVCLIKHIAMALGGRSNMGMGRESHFTAESKAIKALVELLIVHGYV